MYPNGENLDKIVAQMAKVGKKIVAPLGYAVRLVNRKEGNGLLRMQLCQLIQETSSSELFGCHVNQIVDSLRGFTFFLRILPDPKKVAPCSFEIPLSLCN
jgi:hypothetical protein